MKEDKIRKLIHGLTVLLLLWPVSSFGQFSGLESKFIPPNSKLTEVFSGGETFLEGPTMSLDGTLFFSDITFTSVSGMKAGIIWTFDLSSKQSTT